MEPIAVIRLIPGQGGYFDELSRIHLTLGAPEAKIYPGTNCSRIRQSVKSGRLVIVSGALPVDDKPKKVTNPNNDYTKGNFVPKAKAKTTTAAPVKEKQVTAVKKEEVKQPVKKPPETAHIIPKKEVPIKKVEPTKDNKDTTKSAAKKEEKPAAK